MGDFDVAEVVLTTGRILGAGQDLGERSLKLLFGKGALPNLPEKTLLRFPLGFESSNDTFLITLARSIRTTPYCR